MIMCVLLCYPVSFHMLQLLLTGRPISSSPTFYTLIVNFVFYDSIPVAGHNFCVLFFFHFYSKTQNTHSADTEPLHGH